jgi:hypothetical protein
MFRVFSRFDAVSRHRVIAGERPADGAGPRTGSGPVDTALRLYRSTRSPAYPRLKNPGVTGLVENPDRGQALTIDSGRVQVAQVSLAFVERFAER